LYQQIGQLKVELDWLKKNLDLTLEQKRNAIEPGNKKIAVYQQCELLGLNRNPPVNIQLEDTPSQAEKFDCRLF
jgi:hypothetical protein